MPGRVFQAKEATRKREPPSETYLKGKGDQCSQSEGSKEEGASDKLES